MRGAGSVTAVYQWLTNDDFLVKALFPSAAVLEAHVFDDVNTVLSQLPSQRGGFLFHLNCTYTSRFPKSREALISAVQSRGHVVLNGRVTDISKRNIQKTASDSGLLTAAAGRDGDPEEMLFVKSNLNFGGNSEGGLTAEEREFLEVKPTFELMWSSNQYLHMPRKRIDPSWWANPELVIERFIGNPQGIWYRAYIFGDRVAVCELSNPAAIKKVGESLLQRVWMPDDEGAPERIFGALSAFLAGFGLDYGTVDVLVDESGAPYIIDVNSTPAYNYAMPGVVEYLRDASYGGNRS
jgi:hypothetical protein